MKGWDGCIKHEHREEKNKVLGSMTVNQVTVKKVAQRSIQCVSEWAAEHGARRGDRERGGEPDTPRGVNHDGIHPLQSQPNPTHPSTAQSKRGAAGPGASIKKEDAS